MDDFAIDKLDEIARDIDGLVSGKTNIPTMFKIAALNTQIMYLALDERNKMEAAKKNPPPTALTDATDEQLLAEVKRRFYVGAMAKAV